VTIRPFEDGIATSNVSPVDATDPEAIVARERALRDREATVYDAHLSEDPYLRRAEEAVVLEALALDPAHTVVDAGCGTGRLLEALLDRAGHVIGVDHSPASLEVARARVPEEKRPRLELAVGDVRSLPVADATADRVLCMEVLQHVPTAEFRAEAVAELRRILRPGGILILLAYRWLTHVRGRKEGYFGPDLYRYAFTSGEFRALVSGAGFSDVKIGGAAILPGIAERLGMSSSRQARLAFTPLGRLGHYVVARARA
jgi:SAM-dependent methyltransferase